MISAVEKNKIPKEDRVVFGFFLWGGRVCSSE
jgi:hypothetical protein